MPTSNKGSSLLKDLKKIAPLWGIIIFIAIAAVFLLKHFNNAIINYIQYPPNNPFLLSKALMEEGIKYYRLCLHKAEQMKEGGKIPELKNDADLAKSQKLLLKSVELYPANTEVYQYLAALAELQLDKVMTFYYQGLVWVHSGRIAEGLESIEKALKLNPGHETVLEKKIETLLQKNELTSASITLQLLLGLNSKNSNAHFLTGRLNLLRHNPQEAAISLKTALELNPKHLEAAYLYAQILSAGKKFDSAIQVLTSAEEHHPQNARLKHIIGKLFFEQGNFKSAYKKWLRAEKLEKNSAPLYLDLARVTRKLGKERLAHIYLQRALQLEPKLRDKVLQ